MISAFLQKPKPKRQVTAARKSVPAPPAVPKKEVAPKGMAVYDMTVYQLKNDDASMVAPWGWNVTAPQSRPILSPCTFDTVYRKADQHVCPMKTKKVA